MIKLLIFTIIRLYYIGLINIKWIKYSLIFYEEFVCFNTKYNRPA